MDTPENGTKSTEAKCLEQIVRAVDTASISIEEDQPLLKLIKSLVHIVNNEGKTVLTNSQLLDILQKDFKLNTDQRTELEMEIFMTILKRFLKLWPRWDEFDKLVKESKSNPGKNVDAILALESRSLKEYLDSIIKLTEAQMKPILEKLQRSKAKQTQEKEKEKEKVEGEVVMELSCSREQLNSLIYRQPVIDTIFYISDGPTAINLKTFTLPEILNWPNITVSISLPWLECHRTNSSHFERILKNLMLQTTVPKPAVLPTEVYWKNNQSKKRAVKKEAIVKLFTELCDYITALDMKQHQAQKKQEVLDVLMQFKLDLAKGPEVLVLGAEYQFFLSTYKYSRLLYKEPPKGKELNPTFAQSGIKISDFELRMQEIISPAQKFQITRLKSDSNPNATPTLSEDDMKYFWDANTSWLKVECKWCDMRFEGFLTWYHLEQHFIDNHQAEGDWMCQNCKIVYSMQHLACNRWFHTCTATNRNRTPLSNADSNAG